MIMRNTIIGIGEALWDVLPEGKKIGGAPANFAYIVSQFGLRSVAVSALGNDVLGKELQANLDEKSWNIYCQSFRFLPEPYRYSLMLKGYLYMKSRKM